MTRRRFFIVVTFVLLVLGFLPLLSMFIKSIYIEGHFSLASYAGVLTSAHQWTLMKNSLVLSLFVTFLTILVGVPLGVLLGKTDLPFRRFFTALFVIPLLISPYIIAVSWADLLGRNGLMSSMFGLSIPQAVSDALFGLPGCTAILFSIFLPIPMLLTQTFLRTVNPRLEEAGRLTSNWRGVIWGITLPLIMPSILLSAILVFLLSFGEFSVPNFLRYDVYPLESFTQFSAFYNFSTATASTVPLALVTVILLMAEARFLREKTYHVHSFPESSRLPLVPLGKYRQWLFAVVSVLGFLLVLAPIVILLFQSASIDAYANIFKQAGDSLVRSLSYASISATALVILGFSVGYLIQTKGLKIWRSIDTLTIFLFALPSTVIGIGIVSLWNTSWTNFIYTTPLIIILGYLAKYTALTSRISITQLVQIPPSMEDAAQIVGAGWFRRLIYIIIPLAWRGLLGAWLVGYIFSLRDMGITMLVYPAGHETLPVRILTLMANGSPELIAALSIVMITATLLPVGIVWGFSHLMTRKAIL